jgi:hypothetical protein
MINKEVIFTNKKIFALNKISCNPIIILVICLLFTVKLQAQLSDFPCKDTLFFTKKSNPERTILLPLEEIDVNIYWKNGEVDRAYIIGLEDNLIVLRVYADEKVDRNERREAKYAISDDKSLTYHEKVIKKRKVDYQTIRTGKLESIKKIEIRNRDLKGTPISQLLLASDIIIGVSIVAFRFLNIIPIEQNYSLYFLVGVTALDGVALIIDLVYSKSIIRPNDWAIGSTFKRERIDGHNTYTPNMKLHEQHLFRTTHSACRFGIFG